MAPPPEYDKEPKAPDKSVTAITNDPKIIHSINDQQANPEHKTTTTTTNCEVEKNKVEDSVENLDDGSLRALLDEAITYKCPKDREGKSDLFKNLLEEAEQQDDQAPEVATRGLSIGRNTRTRAGGRRALAHSNSLQDLVAALAAEPTPRRHRHPAPTPAPVSARATQGGSLPSGVDTSFLLSEEPGTARAGYLATVRCVNPPPLAERRVSASDANPPPDDALHRRSKPVFPMYTARATLEIGSGSVCSGRAVTTTTASNQGDSAIPFSCITTPEVVASCNTTTSSTSQSAIAVDPKPLQLGSCYRAVASLTGASASDAPAPASASASTPVSAPVSAVSEAPAPTVTCELDNAATALLQPRSVISSSYNGLSLSRGGYGATAGAPPDDYKKSLDENGNAVQGFSSPVSGSSQHKKPRRKKSSKNETVIKSHHIDGYQGNKDLNEVLRFIESNAEHGRGAKLGRTKHKDDADDKAGKKRSTERRKDKEKVKRASSLEELSRTKLEDLTAPREPERLERNERDRKPERLEREHKPERRSWGDDYRAPLAPASAPAPVTAPADTPELTDFQTVTKRRKPRRRTDEHEREPPRRARPPSPAPAARPRRESAPPSERSNDSNDDLEGAHSPPPAPPPPPPVPAPHASYADIARTRHNIPDLIESCNFYAEGEVASAGSTEPGVGAGAAPDADGYPALGDGRLARAGLKVARVRGKERAGGGAVPGAAAGGECPAPDVLGERRPAVILLDAGARGRDLDGVTFGFDINEQLLSGVALAAGRRARCDLLREAEAEAGAGARAVAAAAGAVHVRAGCGPLLYRPPEPPHDTHHLHQIIDYVGNAWEDVVRCGGKARYFSE